MGSMDGRVFHSSSSIRPMCGAGYEVTKSHKKVVACGVCKALSSFR